jgi:hypothetical protein
MKTVPGSLVDRLLTASLVIAPALYLVADVLYAARGWESDPVGAVFHVLGALAFTLVVVRVATWTTDGLAATLLVVGAVGVAGNVAYGFDAIHVALGDVSLVDRVGAATLIKPLGLAFPLTLLLCAVALRKLAPVWVVASIGVAGLAFPVANIADIAPLGVAVSVAALVGFGALALRRAPAAATEPTIAGPTIA